MNPENRIDKCRNNIKKLALAKSDIDLAKSFICQYKNINSNLNLDTKGKELLYSAYNIAVIISYSRPFSNNNLGKISSNFGKFNTFDFQNLHDELVNLRHKSFAHTDVDINQIKVGLINDNRINKYIGLFIGEIKYIALPEEKFYFIEELCNELIDRFDKEIDKIKKHVLEFV